MWKKESIRHGLAARGIRTKNNLKANGFASQIEHFNSVRTAQLFIEELLPKGVWRQYNRYNEYADSPLYEYEKNGKIMATISNETRPKYRKQHKYVVHIYTIN